MSAFKTLIVGGALVAGAYAQTCAGGDINGVCFENSVTNLVYKNLGYSGTYPNVALFDTDTCSVNMGGDTSFSGPLAPLNEEITMHFRGPLQLYNVAVYYPTSSASSKQKKREASLRRRHAHRHMEKKHKRAVEDYTATVTQYSTVYVDPESTPTAAVVQNDEVEAAATYSKTHKSKTHHTTASAAEPTTTGDWERIGYYDSDSESHEGLTFMNNMGSDGISGSWSTCFGNTLSYMGSDGLTAASSSSCLAKDTFFPSNKEFSIWSNNSCDASCGYSQPGTPAMKGFAGDNKVFVFKFQMPKDTSLVNNNMPAIWFLNSKIGRTWQYPNDATKTCWPKCGEADIWEVLDPNSCDYMKSHIHSGQAASDAAGNYGGGGSGDYFERPYDKAMTGAVAFMDDGTMSISVLDDSFDFPTSLDTDTIKGWTPSDAATYEISS